MRYVPGALASVLLLLISCGPSQRRMFGDKRSALDTYGDHLKAASLHTTTMGGLWFGAGTASLQQPAAITLPYRQTGYFAADHPDAESFVFPARRGASLLVSITKRPVSSLIFAELWQYNDDGKPEFLADVDSTGTLVQEIEKDGRYIVRLQPELLAGVEYTVTLTDTATLSFPVSETGRPRLISFWSDERDAGARRHEGVDIAAKFRTPAVAAADGYVQQVTNNRLGGKVVFLRPQGKDYVLYYAHLDSQIVQTGQQVNSGDVLGLVGNTGNARGTIPHLHFGVYAAGGAVDPLPFIDRRPRPVKQAGLSLVHLNQWQRTKLPGNLYHSPIRKSTIVSRQPENTAVRITAAVDNLYRVQLADSSKGFMEASLITSQQMFEAATATAVRLLDRPERSAAVVKTMDAGSNLEVKGKSGDYYLVRYDRLSGWIPVTAISK